jgi:hypothetical protein
MQVEDFIPGNVSLTACGAGKSGLESKIRRILGCPAWSSQTKAKRPKGLGRKVNEIGSLSLLFMRLTFILTLLGMQRT